MSDNAAMIRINTGQVKTGNGDETLKDFAAAMRRWASGVEEKLQEAESGDSGGFTASNDAEQTAAALSQEMAGIRPRLVGGTDERPAWPRQLAHAREGLLEVSQQVADVKSAIKEKEDRAYVQLGSEMVGGKWPPHLSNQGKRDRAVEGELRGNKEYVELTKRLFSLETEEKMRRISLEEIENAWKADREVLRSLTSDLDFWTAVINQRSE